MEEEYVDTSRLSVRLINKSVAGQFVRTHHYSGKLSSARYTLGLYYRKDSHPFFVGEMNELIGCLVYGHPVSNATVTSVFKTTELPLDAILELTRLVVLDGYGKNIESWFIGQSFKWLRENDPAAKVLVSYADPEQDHTGTIYRATNWLYQGCGAGKLMPDYSVRLTEGSGWIHSRTLGAMYGSRSVENLAEKIGHTFWQKKEMPKHRYIYFLPRGRERKKMIADVKIPIIDYSDSEFQEQVIRKIHVKDGKFSHIEVLQGEDTGWKMDKEDS